MSYVLNGKEIKYLNRLVLATVRLYVDEHKETTYEELKNIFSDNIQGSYGVIKNEADLEVFKQYVIDTPKRFFMNEDEIIHLKNGEKIYVCKGWGDDYTDANGNYKKGNKKPFIELVNSLGYDLVSDDEKSTKNKELDREGFKNYLTKLGFASNGINTYLGYINQQKIEILNNFDEYKKLSDEDKILKFSKVDNNFKEEFDRYHQYSKDYTFSDVLSGARRYVIFIQYKNIIQSMQNYQRDNTQYKTDNLYMYFKVFNDTTLYPIKSICRENLEILELDESFTTNQAKSKLNNIFNFKNNKSNIKFIDYRDENIDASKNTNNFKIKNIILYGAPGVGKTHNYKNLISMIEEGESQKDIFDTISKNEEVSLENETFQTIKNEKRVEFVTFHQSYSYEDFIEGFRPNNSGNIELKDGIFKNMVEDALKDDEKNYYIIIDEINRGNISKIFGELITLIEEDKRDVYEVTLPYSKKSFKVPSNLYIIATMNSTDKSIATIDIALRRRFTFLKMKPKSELVKHPDAKELMEKLNFHIGKILGEDYKLGHSYFMKVENDEDLEFVKEYKIKPLLEEYFYADDTNYEEALKILNFNMNFTNE